MSQDTFIHTRADDPLIAAVIAGLFGEYRARYGDYFGEQEAESVDVYAPPDGVFIVLLREGRPIAMGAFKRYDEQTAELKRIWTDTSLRRQGLAQKVVRQLEQLALNLGYRRLFLTTGFRQPEAVRLYLSLHYQPQFDTQRDPESYSLPPYDGRLPFIKLLPLNSVLQTAHKEQAYE
ncbi:MAG: GNAT family N-acetyltransferase [Rouxiella aceris]|uniref:GNAT family N-acetyltransferase n=1 Tax=Rouxiella aceris TaxID=2703884 RepID=UPI00283B829C|nr:GNAT family N-acetyltransferase [Rouxiella aceris]MDR3430940.1 GNAT family N-acetyltransferase [Rouxiella aceris]